MKLLYNSFDITSLGEVTIKQSRELEGGEQTQRAKVRLEVALDLFQRTYDENYAAVQSLRTAIVLPNANLQWTNDAVGVDYVNQTAVLVSDDLPDEWGQYHQTLHLVFEYYEQVPGGAKNNLPLTFNKEASGSTYSFDVVNRWQHSASTERFSTLHKQRRESHGKIRVEGQTFGDTTQALADRRTALSVQAAQLVEQMNSAEGLLQFGAGGSVFSGMVRIEEFSCNLNQLINALDWSFTCSYTLFPNESDYATAEFTVEETNNYTGELHLQVAGKIQAQDVAAAQAKLQAIIAQVLTDNGYLAGQPLSLVTTPNQISANEDGDTFTEMTFSGAWRKWEATNLAATIRGSSSDPLALGNVNKWLDRVDTTRFNALRPHRERTTGIIEAAGVLIPDESLPMANRRAQLLLMAQALKNEVAGVDELTLVFGDWEQVVRVNSFAAQINQAETGIEWSLTADYILFPNLASYATAEYTVAEQDNFTGEVHLTIAGRIQAQDETAARAKLSAILQQQLTDRKYTGGQILVMNATPQLIDDDADGATFTELSFNVEYRKWKKSNQTATFGANPAVSLGNVRTWRDRVNISRFNPLRPMRERAWDIIEAAGTWNGDLSLSLADRRAQLLSVQRAMKAAVNVPQDVLKYGDFSQLVRVTEFAAEINQAETGIDWSLSGTYTLFPNESDYATAEFTVEETNNYTGELHLQVAGKIQAQDVVAAQAKLQAIIKQVLTDNEYLAGQPLGLVTTPNQISANEDGDTFTEMTFSGAWRKWEATNLAATIQGLSADPLALGNVNKWLDRVDTTRFNALRPHRERTTGIIEAAGVLVPDEPNLGLAIQPVVDRRAQLLLMAQALKAEVAGVDELTLVYGEWEQAVRVNSFSAQINQAETGIEWSLSADYILFPNLASYATAEYTVAEQDNFTGEIHLTIAGRIQAQDETAARAKLSAILQQQLTDRKYTGGQILLMNATPQLIDDDADGATFTELSFNVEYRKWKKSNQAATFGTNPAVSLGNVRTWRDRVNISRFNPLRPMRERAWDIIEAAGTWNGDLSLSLADRRAQLLSVQRAMKAAVNVPQDVLKYGDFSQMVRVTEFTAEINQAETGIDWSLSAAYTLFPDENNYTITDFQVATRDNFTGETSLALTGKIQAATLAMAQAKLTALAKTVPAQQGYGKGSQQLTNDVTSNNLSTLDGDTFIELNFSLSWRGWKADNQVMTFKASNGGTLRAFGNVSHWRDHYSAQRFNDLRSQRRHATGSVEASGTIVANGTRAGMLALISQLKKEVNNADGTLTYGLTGQTPYFQQVVRVDDFQAQINQAETGIDWSLSASYSVFPNEGGYATTDFTVADRQELESGDEFLTFAGKIEAPTQALAVAKLNSLRTAVLTSYGWTMGQQLRSESNAQSIYANGDKTTFPTGSGVTDAADGTTFIQLSFNEEYRRRIQGTLVGFTMRLDAREDIPTQTLLTTYAGSVTATGPTADAAYATALAKAQQLGANQETKIDSTAFLLRSEVSFEQRQVTQNSALEFVRITFSYEYQSKLGANRTYLEMTSTVNRDNFGADVETCVGFVAARDTATAQSVYAAQVRALYAGRLIHSEQTGVAQSQNQAQQQGAGLGAGQQWNAGGAQAASTSAFNTQHLKFEFHLQVFTPKLEGEVGIKYAVEVTRDFLMLEMRTAVQGSCYAMDRPTADAAVTALLAALNFGVSVRSRRAEDRQTDGTNDVTLKLDFEEEFVGRVTGQAGVNEMKLSEKVVYSGTRWAVQNLPFNTDGSGGVSIPQPSGIEPGSRTVTGSVTAGTLATAQAWAMAQRALLTGDQNGGNYPQPEQWDTDYEFVPRLDGVATGGGENVRLFRVSFTFAEILPLYPAPAQ